MAPGDLRSEDPMEVYRAVAAMDGDEFERLMDDPEPRQRVIDALIDHMVAIFNPEKAGDLYAIIHIKLWDRPGGGYDHYEMRIAERECHLIEPDGAPDLTLKIRPTDLRKLIVGETGVRRLALMGRLRAVGDLGLGMQLGDLFDF